jgi:hypothetical protein
LSVSRLDSSLRLRPATLFLAVAVSVVSCAGPVPRLVPPPAGVEAVEGYGSASLQGTEAAVKGKFAFLFRRPGLGRVEALDPVGRTAFLIFFRSDRAYFVLPGKKVFAEERPETMMERFLGVSFLPDEMLLLLSGALAGEGNGGWNVERDGAGRVARGEKDGFSFTVREFFPGAGVPRTLGFSGPGTAGRMKVLSLGFDPPPRAGAFDLPFLRSYALKTWAEIVELIDR